MIRGAEAPMLNARRPLSSTSPELWYNLHQDAAERNHGEGDDPVQPAVRPVRCALVQVVSDAIEAKNLHGNAAADPAEDESCYYGLANICISAKISRKVFGRDFSV